MELDFIEVLEMIVRFLEPPYSAIINEGVCEGMWKAESKNYLFAEISQEQE